MQRFPDAHTEFAIASENAYTQACFRPLLRLERRIYRDIVSREHRFRNLDTSHDVNTLIRETIDEYDYYMAEGGHHYQRQHRPSGRIETVLDYQNNFFTRRNFYSINMMKLSPDHRLVAFTMSTDGDERYRLHLCHIQAQIYEEHVIPSYVVSVEWSNNPDVLFYTVPDAKWRPFQLYRWHLMNRSRDLLYEEGDDRFFLDVHRTKDRKYLTINSNSKTTSEIRLLRLDDTDTNPYIFRKRQHGIECYVDHRHDGFYAITNAQNACNYKLIHIDETSGRETLLYQCQEENEKIEDMELFQDAIVLYQKEAGVPFIRLKPRGNSSHVSRPWIKVSIPTVDGVTYAGGVLTPASNVQLDATSICVTYSNLLTPEQILHVCLTSGEIITGSKSTYSFADAYECHKVLINNPIDGIQVPMTIMHKKHLIKDGNHPVLLRAYGAYGHDLDLGFDITLALLLEQGWILCYAHVRGGGELGRSWHTHAIKENKVKSIEDLEACARWLIERAYTRPHRLAIRGMSAGGLVCASAAIANPEIFQGPLILISPFVDIINTMTNRDLPLTVHETEEWGDPLSDPTIFEAMLQYSPYERLKHQTRSLPPIYCTTSLKDIRVPYWHPLKFIARYRRLNPIGSQTSFLSISTHGSHFGSGGQHGAYQDAAREYAFLWNFSSHLPR